ncbi:MAG: S-layer homology domain-containing protein [Clostridia bacterium]|nr:S-layer homology domain-containing protein [Clostridia bacterium]
MKRLIALFLIILMLFSNLLPATADAGYGAELPSYYGMRSANLQGYYSEPAGFPDGLYDYLVQKFRDCEKQIDITGYRLTMADHYAIMEVITNSEPELFHLLNSWDYYLDYTGKYVTVFVPHYSREKAEYDEALKYVRSEADSVVAMVDESWSDLEKALFFHDYLIAWYEYDTSLVVQDIYHFMKSGYGVCEGYQLYYMYLLDKVGIENDYIASRTMAHVWNRVRIDGQWYNVDVTWDEPDNNHVAEIKHRYFMVSDAAIPDHFGSDSDITCTDTKYDDHSWRDAHAAIVPLNGKWYTIIDDYIAEYVPATGEGQKVLDLTEHWPDDTSGRLWADSLSGLSYYKNCLIFISPKALMAYNPDTHAVKVLKQYTGLGYLYDGVVEQSTGRYYVTVGNGRYENGVTTYIQINEADLPDAPTWSEVERVEPTCFNDGYVITRYGDDTSTDKTEVLKSTGHESDGQWYELKDDDGNVTARYQICGKCEHRFNLTTVVPDGVIDRFTDVKAKDWFASAVGYAVGRGLFGGVSATTFAPGTDMSRAMLVTVLWRMEGQPAPAGANPFTDVKDGTWYTTAVVWAYEQGIVGGIGGGKYAPDNTVTREQMATILFRYSAGKGYDLSKEAGIESFPDTDDVSGYAVDGYSWARTMGIIDGMSKGDGKVYLNPKGYATRAQVATMLTRFIVYVCE